MALDQQQIYLQNETETINCTLESICVITSETANG